jgi:hypothetical protein
MPVLYFASDGRERPLERRATLTFVELRGMFGGYECRYVSRDWRKSALETGVRMPAGVLVEVSERDGVARPYHKPGFYLLADLAPAKVDELLKYRDSYAQRLDAAERWEVAHTHVPRRRRR